MTIDRHFLKTALVYLAMVSFGLAEPLFNVVTLFRREFLIGTFDAVLIVLVFQYALTLVLLGLRRAARRRVEAFDFLVFAAAGLSVMRQLQQTVFQTEFLGGSAKLGMILLMVGGTVLLVGLFRRAIGQYAVFLGVLAPLFGLYFIYAMAQHPLLPEAGTPAPVPKPDAGPPVFMVVFDELSLPVLLDSKGGIDGRRFPNFKALAADSVWYRQAMANHPGTNFSIPSMLTGTYRPGPVTGTFADDMETLPPGALTNRLQNMGYRVVMASDTFGCAEKTFRCPKYLDGASPGFLGRVLSKFLQEFGPDYLVDRWAPFLHGGLLESQHDRLARLGAGGRPGTFYMIHLLASHAPYVFDADGGYLRSPDLRMVSGANFPRALANYRAQLGFMDRAIGRFTRALKESGLYDRAVIMVGSDHGNCWTPACPGRVYPGRIKVLEPDLPRVPVLIRAPGLAPRVDDGDFQLVDVMPTLLQALGRPVRDSQNLDGRPALLPGLPARPRLFFIGPNRPPLDIGLPVVATPVPGKTK